MSGSHDHFHGKSIDKHIVEKFIQGVQLSQEPHGMETGGGWTACIDSARMGAFTLVLLLLLLPQLEGVTAALAVAILSLAYAGRSAWTGWSRLEKLHRLLDQERDEIEHHRDQEREELKALYHLKGFEEPLLTQVCDVLMADSDRLLTVMLEEELGLTLAVYEHPFMLALWSALGSLVASGVLLLSYIYCPLGLIYFASFFIGGMGVMQAYNLGNDRLHAFVTSGSGCFILLTLARLLNTYLSGSL